MCCVPATLEPNGPVFIPTTGAHRLGGDHKGLGGNSTAFVGNNSRNTCHPLKLCRRLQARWGTVGHLARTSFRLATFPRCLIPSTFPLPPFPSPSPPSRYPEPFCGAQARPTNASAPFCEMDVHGISGSRTTPDILKPPNASKFTRFLIQA